MFSHSSRGRLTDRDLDRFPAGTLFDRLARAVCHAGCLPRKELYEAWEVARRVRRLFRGGRIVDLGGGHGLLALVMLIIGFISYLVYGIMDRNWLHLEARYNYEDLETVSAWVGYNLSGGGKLAWEFTPMLGGVFGNTTGIAPGYRGTLSWWKLELYSEGEYVFDTGNSSDNFFYNWSELSLAPVDWFRFGLAVQRTKLYQTDFDLQRGFLVGFSFKRLDLTTYVFNPDDQPTFVFAVGVSF